MLLLVFSTRSATILRDCGRKYFVIEFLHANRTKSAQKPIR
jgi:hypothetical protein